MIERYNLTILPSIKSSEDIERHLLWWKTKLGSYALQVITPDMIARQRQALLTGATSKGTKRAPATVNRYMASLSAVFSYGVKECGWILENPMLKVSKLKEPRGRDRVLSKEECTRLLEACKKSKSSFLLPIVVLAISTGMRHGEILSLKWDQINLERGIVFLKGKRQTNPSF